MILDVAKVPMTINQIAAAAGLHPERVRYSLSCLHFKQRVYIHSWRTAVEPDGKTRTRPVFLAGSGFDAEPPPGVSRRGFVMRFAAPAGAEALRMAIGTWIITGDGNA